MPKLTVVAERVIGVPADVAYRLLADYRDHHHRYLPPAFSDWLVERGGVGAGTVVRFRVTLGGRTRPYRVTVAEPEPGQVLSESDPAVGLFTTSTVFPEGNRCRVRFETVWPAAAGPAGMVERLFGARLLRRLYADELERLDRYARRAMNSGAVSAQRDRPSNEAERTGAAG